MKTKIGKKILSIVFLTFLAIPIYADCLSDFNYTVGHAMMTHANNELNCATLPAYQQWMCGYENDMQYNQAFDQAVSDYNACCGAGC